jgi:hypothetical protein
VTTLLVSLPLWSTTQASDVRYNTGDGNAAGSTVIIDWTYPNNSRNPFNSVSNVNVTCERRVKVFTGNDDEANIWIPFDPRNYKSFHPKFTRIIVNKGTVWVRPFYTSHSDTSFVTIASVDSTVVGWSTRAEVDSLRMWSDVDGTWVTLYAE